MKHTNKKKGFTLVELVIVIAVIAILAGVMVATFSNVVDKANKSADLQEVKSSLDAFHRRGSAADCFVGRWERFCCLF